MNKNYYSNLNNFKFVYLIEILIIYFLTGF
jgi:hypothetical protein